MDSMNSIYILCRTLDLNSVRDLFVKFVIKSCLFARDVATETISGDLRLITL